MNLGAFAQSLCEIVAVHVKKIHLEECDVRTKLHCDGQGGVC